MECIENRVYCNRVLYDHQKCIWSTFDRRSGESN